MARRDDLRTDQQHAHLRPPIQVPNRDPSLARHEGEHGRALTGGAADHRSVGEDPESDRSSKPSSDDASSQESGTEGTSASVSDHRPHQGRLGATRREQAPCRRRGACQDAAKAVRIPMTRLRQRCSVYARSSVTWLRAAIHEGPAGLKGLLQVGDPFRIFVAAPNHHVRAAQ